MNTPVPITAIHCTLGEGPIWDSRNDLICWVDIVNGDIHEYSPDTKKLRSIHFPEMVGTIAFTEKGNYITALQNGFAIVDRQTGKVSKIIDPESHLPGNRFNEGKCDPAGRFWAGTMSLTEEKGAGSLYQLDHQLQIKKMVDQLTISNGMAWKSDKKTFYFIDTPTQQVAKYDYDNATGSISNKQIVITIDPADGYPDGMTIDSQGMLWIAHWGGSQVSRWNPDDNSLLLRVSLPVKNVTSCAFGGKTLNDLYITTARKDLSSYELQNQPFSGCLFVIKDCGYTGLDSFRFRSNTY